MLIFKQGNLLQSNCDFILHQTNCYKTMGAGIAKQIRFKYPEAFQADQQDPRTPNERLGSFSYGYHERTHQCIVNVYGQLKYGTKECQTDYQALKQALEEVFSWITEIDHQKAFTIGLPYGMGCGLAGGDWNIVRSILEEVSHPFQRDIIIYKLNE